MEAQKAEGIQARCNTISFATLAEIHHFHQVRVRDFKSQMQHFLQQQIIFFQKVTQKLEEALHNLDTTGSQRLVLRPRWAGLDDTD
ncbi:sorting nexin-18-like [Myotis lucifugus]|uniref:sorting nexin-18-like n=1 Tax=Myotis lucifugus TaxID=59463 RepID=UPI0006D71C3C|nr:sorting nexin-18-like [Myotis lucifugus]